MSRLLVLLTFLAMSPPDLFELPGNDAGAPLAQEIAEVGDRCSELHRDVFDALLPDGKSER